MDVTLPKILPAGAGDAAFKAADAARSAFGTSSTRGADAGLKIQGTDGVVGGSPAQNVMQSFSTLLSQAVQDLNQAQTIADDGAAKLAAGEPVDLHNVMIGMESANLSFGMALQVRNKLLEAYQEVMRMVI